MNRFSLSGKNILVTGASSGIGASCCKVCSESGANLILLGRSNEKLNHTFKQLDHGDHSVISFDLMQLEGLENALSPVISKYGKIHGFIHSAGIDITLPINSLREKDYNLLFTTNVTSGFEIARILSKKQYCPVSGSSFVFIASIMGLVGESAKVGYSASKGALLAGCRSMALELSAKKIRVNCISPAIVQTELVNKLFRELPEGAGEKIKSLHPLGFGEPLDIANACIYLLSDEARWITGSNLVIDGGYSCQ